VVHGTLTGGGLGFRLLIGGDWPGFSGWLAGALFVPTFALALGVWSGSSKLFEALYTLWWYVLNVRTGYAALPAARSRSRKDSVWILLPRKGKVAATWNTTSSRPVPCSHSFRAPCICIICKGATRNQTA
jgi:hypothetical protein